MSEEEALLAAIYANPDDDTPRLVYADWLDEHDQPERAEFIRLQIELTNQDDDKTDEFRRLWNRQDELQRAHERQWLSHLAPFCEESVYVDFLRGFPEKVVVCDELQELNNLIQLIRRLPGLRHIEMGGSTLTPDVLRAVAQLPRLESFHTEYTSFDPSWLTLLDPLPCWTFVSLWGADIEAADWAAFQERRISKVTQLPPDQQRLAAIRFLRGEKWHNRSLRPGRPVKKAILSQISTIDPELRLLSYLPELEEIEICEGHETSAGLRYLAGLPNLKAVHLSCTEAESLVPLMNCTTLERLKYYGDGAPFSDASVAGLERLSNLKALTQPAGTCFVGGPCSPFVGRHCRGHSQHAGRVL